MTQPIRAVLPILALGLVVVAAVPPEALAQKGALRQEFVTRFLNEKAPDFTLRDQVGEKVTLADFRGRPVLLNFWYSSCMPCRKEIPDLATLHQLHHKKGLVILGINLDDVVIPLARGMLLKSFLDEVEVPYPTLTGDLEVFKAYGSVPAQPTTFLIDPEGTIVEIFWGARPGKVFDKAVRPYLGNGKSAGP